MLYTLNMSTTLATPQAERTKQKGRRAPKDETMASPTNVKPITISKTVFDLDSKDDVSVMKAGTFTPVATMSEFSERMAGDTDQALKIINVALEMYAKEQLESDNSISWKTQKEDGTAGDDFSGTLLSPEKSKQLDATVLNLAKTMFGYPDSPRGGNKNLSEEEIKSQRATKSKAKQEALDFILSSPAAIERLKGK